MYTYIHVYTYTYIHGNANADTQVHANVWPVHAQPTQGTVQTSQLLPPDENLSSIEVNDEMYINYALRSMGIKESNCEAFLGTISSIETPRKGQVRWNQDESHALQELTKHGRYVTHHVTEFYSPPSICRDGRKNGPHSRHVICPNSGRPRR